VINQVRLYYSTIKYLKFKQIWYRAYYLVRNAFNSVIHLPSESSKVLTYKRNDLNLHSSISSYKSYLDSNKFKFLNKQKEFTDGIQWNYRDYGKLWTYNLNYFDFLHQPGMTASTGLSYIQDFVSNWHIIKDGKEPYPTSLRGINWIKFFIKNNIKDRKSEGHLYQQYYNLIKNTEFHLMGNHLLENGCSLLFGAYYFNDYKLYNKSKRILRNQLREQILNDGGHFERSPMYHQIILYRLLDCLNLVQNNYQFGHELEPLLYNVSQKMLTWLYSITFNNGNIPHINDSTIGIAPTTKQITEYASALGININKNSSLVDSGYRIINYPSYEMIVDVGNIGPDYIPGHAHCDTFSFILNINGQPIIVDTGTSTYENNEMRIRERSTNAHNTVSVNGYEQSEMWSGFRVGNRAKIIDLVEEEGYIRATHDGFKSRGFLHERQWNYNSKKIEISDKISGSIKRINQAEAFLHFHPTVELRLISNSIHVLNSVIVIEGHDYIEKKGYSFAAGFNKVTEAYKIIIGFKNNLNMIIKP